MKGHLESVEDAMKHILKEIKFCEYLTLPDSQKKKNLFVGSQCNKYCKD